MKQYERFLIYGLLLILLILIGWFIDNKTKTERYKCWHVGGDYVGAYILDTKTGHLYMARGYSGTKIRDLGAIGDVPIRLDLIPAHFGLQPLKEIETAEKDYDRLKKAGFSEEEIKRYILEKAGFTDKEINKLFSDENTPTVNKQKDIFDIVADDNTPTANK